MTPKSRTIAGGIAAAVLGGGVTTALLLGPSPTSAAPPTSSEVVDDDSDAEAETEDTDARGEGLRELLQPLVDSGTLTAEQADAIVAELTETIDLPPSPDIFVGPDRPGFPGGDEFPGGRIGGPFRSHLPMVNIEVIAEAIGIDVAELSEELQSGATIAEIAEANGVDPQAVIDALVAEYTERVTGIVEGEQPDTDEAEPDATDATTETTSA